MHKITLILFALLVLTTVQTSHAFTTKGDAWSLTNMPVDYWINLDMTNIGSATADEISSAQLGADTWTNDGNSNFIFNYAGTNSDTNSTSSNGLNTIMSYDATGSCFTSSTLGTVRGYAWYWTDYTGYIEDSYVVICEGNFSLDDGSYHAANWNIGASNPAGDQLDLASVIAHELGHTLGLDHSCDDDPSTTPPDCAGDCGSGTDDTTDATMCFMSIWGSTIFRDLNTDDIAGIQDIYGVYDLDMDGMSILDGDCDDNDASIYPGAVDLCDGIDNDCDGMIDQSCDDDNDGLTNSEEASLGTDPNNPDTDNDNLSDGDEVNIYNTDPLDNDSDDDGIDDGQEIDLGLEPNTSDNPAVPIILSLLLTDDDIDGDGYESGIGGDCNDFDATIYPGATETCDDGVDQDCDNADLSCNDVDDDGDGYTENQGDCDDNDADIHPNRKDCEVVKFKRFNGAILSLYVADGIDNDCDGSIDEDTCGYRWWDDVIFMPIEDLSSILNP